MFDIFRKDHIPGDKVISVARPLINELEDVLGKVPDQKTWLAIYDQFFSSGYVTGYVYGASIVFAEKGGDEFNVKKEFYYRWTDSVRVFKCTINELFGDTDHAQMHRDILASSKDQPLKLFQHGVSHGKEDATSEIANGYFIHHLKETLKLNGFASLEYTYSLLDVLKVKPDC